MKLYNSTHNFYRGDSCSILDNYNSTNEISSLTLVKNEEFGFFASFNVPNESCVNLMQNYDLPWWELDRRYRLAVESDIPGISPHLLEYVKDDDGLYKADIILKSQSHNYPKGEIPIFISGQVPKSFQGDSFVISLKLYESKGYEKENLTDSIDVNVNVLDFYLDNEFQDSFFLDLWQHPCSWARVYDVEYYSDEHFKIIENYLNGMKAIGQKVINLVVSDFPWAGQKCFDIDRNASRLYEYNIIKVSRKNGKLALDFSNLDRYVELCFQIGIQDEINLFGLIGNWHGYDFGSPLEDYIDPIRVKVYDEDEKLYDFLRDKDELKTYISMIFDHLHERDYLKITKIIGDEPGSLEKFQSFSSFIESCTTHEVVFKYALHSPEFLKEYKGNLDSFSINTILMGDYCKDGELVGKLADSFPEMTWYCCCFPDTLNSFIKNPLIEQRYFGLYTYLFKMKGMLRWAYGIFVENVFEDIVYKPEKWPAGDMMLVYPGKDGKPLHSLRERNMFYGIQDFNILKIIEKQNNNLYSEIRSEFQINHLISYENEDIVLDKYVDFNDYLKTGNAILEAYIKEAKNSGNKLD